MKIPTGINTGNHLRMEGKGHDGKDGSGDLDCNTTSTKYILKSNQSGLDTYIGNQKYLVTASIKEPRAVCMRSGYIFYEEEVTSSIPDANIFVALLVACFALFIMQRKRI